MTMKMPMKKLDPSIKAMHQERQRTVQEVPLKRKAENPKNAMKQPITTGTRRTIKITQVMRNRTTTKTMLKCRRF